MSKERINAIARMLEAWNHTDNYDEDSEKTEIIEELLAELATRIMKERTRV